MKLKIIYYGTQKWFHINVETFKEIRSIKVMAHRMGLIEIPCTFLYFGQELEDDKTIEYYNIPDGGSIAYARSVESAMRPLVDTMNESKSTYKIGDLVVSFDESIGGYRTAIIIACEKKKSLANMTLNFETINTNLTSMYTVKYRCEACFQNYLNGLGGNCQSCVQGQTAVVCFKRLKPHPRRKIKVSHMKVGDQVIVKSSDFYKGGAEDIFFLCRVTQMTNDIVEVDILHYKNAILQQNKLLAANTTFYHHEELGDQCNINSIDDMVNFYEATPKCLECKDQLSGKCPYCLCFRCGKYSNEKAAVFCPRCCKNIHLTCLDPPLSGIPTDKNWYIRYCPMCIDDDDDDDDDEEETTDTLDEFDIDVQSDSDVQIVKKLKRSIIPKTMEEKGQFGPIPGVDVGMSWEYRKQISQAGGHRPLVAGIHGQPKRGAFSVVLSGGYEDDQDFGDTFIFTGSGGRDLSGNKRCAQQSKDQEFSGCNLALARNCYALLSENGGDAQDNWKYGNPVRVFRSYKSSKQSIYAPSFGIRYDGIYKIRKYWKERGLAGFYVWRYLFERDDVIPPPWTEEGYVSK
ncbi:DgyrCDS11338 [Dimorphilus gyrociliatus]|uniref:DgyrCDS11338 n=1 Tax=Dimorphilus gyrociliatus TaxID=2664684 RepID=A0A7I8W5I9_9ANNE|nr:DgyrCDS11338 [Dimorphilus gyrociliatus]